MGSRYSSAYKVFSYNKTSNKAIKKSTCQPSLNISQGTGKGGGVKGGEEKGGRKGGEKREGEKRRGEEGRREGEGRREERRLREGRLSLFNMKALTNLCSASNLVPNYASRYL